MLSGTRARYVRLLWSDGSFTMPIDPLTLGKIRAGRDDGRRTEDDVARQREGEQGIPGQAKPQLKSDERLQNPKPLDPGHTA